MENLSIIGWVLGILITVYLVIAVVGTLQTLAIGRAIIRPLSEGEENQVQRESGSAVSPQWAEAHGFEWAGAFAVQTFVPGIRIAAWKQQNSPTYLCVYVIGGNATNIDFVSLFDLDTDVGITTGTTLDGHLLPHRPGSWMQTFSYAPVEQLWKRHMEAEVAVAELTHIVPRDLPLSFEEVLTTAVKRQIGYVRNISFWPLRMPIWFLWRRYKLNNWPIVEQIAAGKTNGTG